MAWIYSSPIGVARMGSKVSKLASNLLETCLTKFNWNLDV